MPMGDPTQQKSGKEAPGAEHHHGMTSEASDTHLKNVKSWFGTHAQQWSDSYTDVRRVKDIVLINRKNIAVDWIRGHLPAGARILDACHSMSRQTSGC
jgi:hypothetical protein